MPLQYTCESCGIPFRRKPSQRAPGRRFCSYACRSAASRASRTRTCALCGQSYVAERANRTSHYCSVACRIASRRKPTVHWTCVVCGTQVARRAGQEGSRRFCSVSCASTYTAGAKRSTYKVAGTRLTPRTPYEKPGYRKRACAVRKRDGYRCQQCGRQWTHGMRTFEVHHVIPIRLGGADDVANLITLCTRCHRRADLALRSR